MGSFRSRPIPVLVDGRHLAGAGSTRGFGRYLRSLLPELAQLHDVTVSVLMTAPAVHAVPRGICAIPIQRGLPLPGRFGDLEHHVRLPLDVARHRQGVFHNAASERAPWLCGHPWVHTIHDVPLSFTGAEHSDETQLWCRRRRRVRRADAVLAVSRFAADNAIALLGLDAARVRVVSSGVAETFCPSPDRPPGSGEPGGPAPYVLLVGDYGPHKGYREAFELIGALADRGLPHVLLVVGRLGSWDRPAIDELVAGSPRPPRIRLVGAANDDELLRWYRGADALVVPSRAEGFGLPAVEAMACGTPVVAFDNTALPEVIGDGGLLVPDGDVGALAEAVGSLVSDPEGWRAASAAAFRRSRAFSWSTCAAAHVDAYRAASAGARSA